MRLQQTLLRLNSLARATELSMASSVTLRNITTNEDIERAAKFAWESFNDEPLASMVNIQREEFLEEDGLTMKYDMKDGLSLLAVDSETNVICGMAVVNYPALQAYCVRRPSTDTKTGILARFANSVMSEFSKALNDNQTIMFIDQINVHPNYRRRGICKRLMMRVENQARELRCEMIAALATSKYSRTLFLNRGYQIAKEVLYKDYVDSLLKTKPFRNPPMPHTSTSLCVKYLN